MVLATHSYGVNAIVRRGVNQESGVCFAIKSVPVGKLTGLPKGVNDRQMTLGFVLSGIKHATIISTYGPTMANPYEVKDNMMT